MHMNRWKFKVFQFIKYQESQKRLSNKQFLFNTNGRIIDWDLLQSYNTTDIEIKK